MSLNGLPTCEGHSLSVNSAQGLGLSGCRVSAHSCSLWTVWQTAVDALTQVDEIPEATNTE